jgi:hypothetical protein
MVERRCLVWIGAKGPACVNVIPPLLLRRSKDLTLVYCVYHAAGECGG